MTNKYTEDDYCDIYSKKICDNCGKCLEENGVDIRAINIDDIAKTVEENSFIEDELKKALELLNEENREEDIEEEIDIDIQSELEEDYIDAFDNIVYLDEIGVEEDSELDELTEEIYPGIRKLKRNK
ncbi:hypothetical protein [Clostridium celatum]|uniref:hypothetical protein n=1 Tax=Clostridium celatum TaxID=36834 RepID=UPI001F1F40EC|nr:hypothetical protein [Clostridium celatum]MCE9656759.1 hypothetical protein [Clostridium celatum]MDU3722889.1 hypothetical protein [Clostridium celatum]MDU6296662.1 hypothetical protein [Clostridium celatum]MDY3362200.1 hypothetical protein [Clostridium celatum]